MLLPTLGTILHTLGHAAATRIADAVRHTAKRERKLRVGIDIRPFYEPLTGVGWYLYHLLHALAAHDDVELYLFGDARVTDAGPRLHADIPAKARLCVFDLRGKPLSRFSRPLTAGAYVVWMQLIHCDLMFGANYFLPRLLGAAARRRVVTVHDLTYRRFPELLQTETLRSLERQMLREIAQADAVICVSESTRRDLLASYEIDPSRVDAILSGLGPSPPAAPLDRHLPARYILFVSTIEPRKNLPLLIDAFEALRKRRDYAGDLVVVGRIGWKAESLARRLRGPGIHHLDYLQPAQLTTVYERAEMFVFPSLYEGFGFPLLEAMAHGVPSIAARTSSLPEVGGDAALYFDPHDARELEAHIARIAADRDLRESLIVKGRARAAEFGWGRAAAETLAVFKRVASS